MITDRTNYTVPLTEEERAYVDSRMTEYGYKQFAPFVRFAIQQLPDKKR